MSSKVKAFVDGASIARFAEAVQTSDMTQVRSLLASRPELVSIDRSEGDEHRGLHYAVLRRDAPMVRLLMEAGADARKGIWPHRDATSAWTLAQERHFDDIVAIIEEEELHRREEMSCLNAVAMLIDHGVRLDMRDDLLKSTPLGWACFWGRTEMVKLLIQRGAPVRERDAEAWAAPAAWAQKMGYVEIEAILKQNLEPNSRSI